MHQYYIAMPGGQPRGPYSAEQVAKAVAAGRITTSSLICPVGGTTWMPIGKVFPANAGPAQTAPMRPAPMHATSVAQANPMGVQQLAHPTVFTPFRVSGKMGSQWPLAMLLGAATAFAAGGAYGWINVYNPVVGVLTAVIAVCAGCGVGMVTGLGVRQFQIRNPAGAALMGACGGLILLAFSWVSFITVLCWSRLEAPLVPSWFELAFSPIVSLEFASSLLETGWYQIKGWSPSGIILFLGWLVEACCMVGMSAFVAWQKGSKPFAEQAGQWYDERVLPAGFAVPGQNPATTGALRPEQLPLLVAVPVSGPHLRLTAYSVQAPGCPPLLSAERVRYEGKKPKADDVMDAHYVPAEVIARLSATSPA